MSDKLKEVKKHEKYDEDSMSELHLITENTERLWIRKNKILRNERNFSQTAVYCALVRFYRKVAGEYREESARNGYKFLVRDIKRFAYEIVCEEF